MVRNYAGYGEGKTDETENINLHKSFSFYLFFPQIYKNGASMYTFKSYIKNYDMLTMHYLI